LLFIFAPLDPEAQFLGEEPFCGLRYRGTETFLGIVAALAARGYGNSEKP
jgi:hypothetical protein